MIVGMTALVTAQDVSKIAPFTIFLITGRLLDINLLPVPSPLLDRELDRLLNGLTMVDEKYGVSLYRRLLMAWKMQNKMKVDEERDMPDYQELGA